MSLSTYLVRPSRCALVNVRTGEHVECLFNPPQLLEKVQVHWNRQVVLGLSHQVLQYQSTGNRTFGPLDFYLDRFFARAMDQDADVMAFATFMRALTVPAVGASGISTGAPPRTLIVWPNVMTVEAVVTELEMKFTDFARDGSVLLYTAACGFEEILDVRRDAPTDEVTA